MTGNSGGGSGGSSGGGSSGTPGVTKPRTDVSGKLSVGCKFMDSIFSVPRSKLRGWASRAVPSSSVVFLLCVAK